MVSKADHLDTMISYEKISGSYRDERGVSCELTLDFLGRQLLKSFLYIFPVVDAYALVLNKVAPFTIYSKIFVYFAFFIGLLTSKRIAANRWMYVIAIHILGFVSIVLTSWSDSGAFWFSAGSLIRLLFPLVLFVTLNLHQHKLRINCTRYTIFIASIYLSSILLGTFTGTGGVIHGRGTLFVAQKGFFIGANEVGLILIILVAFVFIREASLGKTSTIIYSLVALCGILVFTKSSLFASVVVVFCFFRKHKVLSILTIIIFLFFLAINTDSVHSSLIKILEESFFVNARQGLEVFLFRGRQTYVEGFFKYGLSKRDFFSTLTFGLGEYEVARRVAVNIGIPVGERSTFEMDFLDLFFSLGLFVSAVYTSIIYKYLLQLRKMKPRSMFLRFLFFSIFVHSMLAGHVLFSPQVTSLICVFLFCLGQREYYKR